MKNTDSNQISISITKDGGYILSYLNSRNIDGERLDINSATDKAAEFFAEKRFCSMQSSYYEKSGGIATINFAYVQDNVTCYSDLVKVRVTRYG